MNRRAPRDAAWTGQITLGAGWAAFRGSAGDNAVHRHPALQLAIGVGPTVRATVADTSYEGAGLLIGPNVPHRVNPGPMWLLYIDGASAAGRRLSEDLPTGIRVLSERDCARLAASVPRPDATAQWVADLLGHGPKAVHERAHRRLTAASARVRATIDRLPHLPAEDWTLKKAAGRAALSTRRFAALFHPEVGMTFRPYVRWLRLARALIAAASGKSLTDAAQDAGFADAAHLSRTMRRHFGVAPHAVLASLRAGR